MAQSLRKAATLANRVAGAPTAIAPDSMRAPGGTGPNTRASARAAKTATAAPAADTTEIAGKRTRSASQKSHPGDAVATARTSDMPTAGAARKCRTCDAPMRGHPKGTCLGKAAKTQELNDKTDRAQADLDAARAVLLRSRLDEVVAAAIEDNNGKVDPERILIAIGAAGLSLPPRMTIAQLIPPSLDDDTDSSGSEDERPPKRPCRSSRPGVSLMARMDGGAANGDGDVVGAADGGAADGGAADGGAADGGAGKGDGDADGAGKGAGNADGDGAADVLMTDAPLVPGAPQPGVDTDSGALGGRAREGNGLRDTGIDTGVGREPGEVANGGQQPVEQPKARGPSGQRRTSKKAMKPLPNGFKVTLAGLEPMDLERSAKDKEEFPTQTEKAKRLNRLFESVAQKGWQIASRIDGWGICLFVPKGGRGEMRSWHSDQVEGDAPGLPDELRKLMLERLEPLREQYTEELRKQKQQARKEVEYWKERAAEGQRELDLLRNKLDASQIQHERS